MMMDILNILNMLKRSKTIIQLQKPIKNPNINVIKSVIIKHSKPARKLSKTTTQDKRASLVDVGKNFTSPLCSKTIKSECFL